MAASSRHLRAVFAAGLFAALPLAAQLQVLTSALPAGYVSKAYPATQLYAQGGTAPYTFTLISGTLPAGLSFSTPAGILSGTPTGVPGSASLTFRVNDSAAGLATRTLSLAVRFPPVPPSWTVKGLYGGRITRIAASPNYPLDSTLFAAGTQGELFRSPDKGLNWNRMLPDPDHAGGGGLTGLVLSPVFNAGGATPAEKTLFVASVEMGVFRSTDGGLTFAAAKTGLPCSGDPACYFGQPSIVSLEISPAYDLDGTLWAIAKVGFGADFVVFRTQDGGASWSRLSTIPYCTGTDIQRIYASPYYSVDNTLFAHACNVLRRSLSGGAAWTPIFADPYGSAPGFSALVLSPDYATDQTLVIENRHLDFYRSHDGGTTFTQVPMAGTHLSVAPRAGRTPAWYFVRMVAFGGPVPPPYQLARSDDGMRTPVPVFGDGYPAPVNYNEVGAVTGAVAATGAEPDLHYGVSLGLYGSYDNGESFSSRDRGLSAYENYYMAGTGSDVVGCAVGAWFKSADTGVSWVRQPLPVAAGVCTLTAVSPDYATDRTLFLADRFNGLYRSGDGGQSFSLVFSGAEVRSFAFVPGYAGGNGTIYLGATTGLQRSTDGGRSFSPLTLSADCSNAAVAGLAVSPSYASDTTVFAAMYSSGSTGGLCRSVDGGTNWVSLKNGTFRIYGPIALSPVYNNNAVNGTAQKTLLLFNQPNYQLLRSSDGGNSWSGSSFPGIVDGEPRISPNFVADHTALFYSGVGSYASGQKFGLFRSSDDGATFTALGAADGLKSRPTSGLYLPPTFNGNAASGSPAVAAGYGSGIWRSDDGARSFAPVSAFSTVSGAINGMTRAADGTLYVASADAGVFRSTDGGALFTRYAAGLPTGANVNAVGAAAAAPANPVAGVLNQGLWRLSGAAWSQLPAQTSGNFVSFHDDGVNLYASRSDGISLVSGNGGASWSPQDPAQTSLVNIDFNNQAGPTTLAPSVNAKSAQGMAAVNTASLWSVAQSGGPRYSTNNGTTWLPATGTGDYTLPPGLNYKTVKALGINPATGSRDVLVGTAAGMYKSRDGGDGWRSVSALGSGLEGTSLNFSAFVTSQTAANTTDILAGITGATTGGVYLSGDGGEHWTQINQGFDPNSLNISTLIKTSCSGCPVQYYTGTFGSGVYTRTVAVNAAPAFPSASAACFGSTFCACGTIGWNGPESGGQPFKLCGANFLALPVVEFDGIPATGCAMISGGTVITCTGTPLHVPGNAAVRVRNTDTRTGYLPALYTYNGGGSRAIDLHVAKSGNDAALTYTCAGCSSPQPRVYRSQNAPFSLNVEQYTGGAASYTNTGALAAGANPTYFWSVE